MCDWYKVCLYVFIDVWYTLHDACNDEIMHSYTVNTSTVVETFMWLKQTLNEDANLTMMHAPFEDDVSKMMNVQ